MIRKRSIALLVPLAAGVLLLNPWTNQLIDRLRYGEPGHSGWLLHFWFLASLWIYVALFPLLCRLIGHRAVRGTVERLERLPRDLGVVLVALAVASALVALRLVEAVALDLGLGESKLSWVVSATLRYLPYFVLGALLHRAPALFERLHRVSWPALALGLALVLLVRAASDALPGPVATVAEVFARAALTLPITAALLWTARRYFSPASRLVARATAAMYTIYIFHYLFLHILAAMLHETIPNAALLYAVLVPLTLAGGYVLHVGVIARVPLLRFLFNGILPEPRLRPAMQAA